MNLAELLSYRIERPNSPLIPNEESLEPNPDVSLLQQALADYQQPNVLTNYKTPALFNRTKNPPSNPDLEMVKDLTNSLPGFVGRGLAVANEIVNVPALKAALSPFYESAKQAAIRENTTLENLFAPSRYTDEYKESLVKPAKVLDKELNLVQNPYVWKDYFDNTSAPLYQRDFKPSTSDWIGGAINLASFGSGSALTNAAKAVGKTATNAVKHGMKAAKYSSKADDVLRQAENVADTIRNERAIEAGSKISGATKTKEALDKSINRADLELDDLYKRYNDAMYNGNIEESKILFDQIKNLTKSNNARTSAIKGLDSVINKSDDTYRKALDQVDEILKEGGERSAKYKNLASTEMDRVLNTLTTGGRSSLKSAAELPLKFTGPAFNQLGDYLYSKEDWTGSTDTLTPDDGKEINNRMNSSVVNQEDLNSIDDPNDTSFYRNPEEIVAPEETAVLAVSNKPKELLSQASVKNTLPSPTHSTETSTPVINNSVFQNLINQAQGESTRDKVLPILKELEQAKGNARAEVIRNPLFWLSTAINTVFGLPRGVNPWGVAQQNLSEYAESDPKVQRLVEQAKLFGADSLTKKQQIDTQSGLYKTIFDLANEEQKLRIQAQNANTEEAKVSALAEANKIKTQLDLLKLQTNAQTRLEAARIRAGKNQVDYKKRYLTMKATNPKSALGLLNTWVKYGIIKPEEAERLAKL